MSIASSPDCLFRLEDKSLKMLIPSIEDPVPNAFDDYLNNEVYDLTDDDKNEADYADTEDFFQSQQLTSDSNPLSPIAEPSTTEKSPQPWRKGLWCLNQGRGSEIVIEKRRNNGRRNYEAVPKSIALHNSHFATLIPRSPPATPYYQGGRNAMTSPRAAKPLQTPHVRQTFSREATLSPSPMYAQLPHYGNMRYLDTWQQDFQNFHLQLTPDEQPTSPPGSGSLYNPHLSARQVNAAVVAQNAATMRKARNNAGAHFNAIDPGLLDPSYIHGAQLQQSSYEQSNETALHYAQTSQQPIPVWVSDDQDSSSSSQYSYHTSANGMIGNSGQTWWSPQIASLPQQEFYPNTVAPAPQQLPHQILHQSTEMHNGGLGIHYPDPSHSALSELPPSIVTLSPPSNSLTLYPPLPPPSHPHFTQLDPFATPRHRRHASPSRSPSPSISPSNTTRSLRQRSPTRTDYNHNRRKSLHKAGPIRDKDNGNSSKTPRTPRTPKTPTNGSSGFDFVNFTPKDHAKLLSDVAPSGSSKTRARREAEARDKRKRLSEAAMKAVRRAGGDVAALEKAILT